MRRSVRHRLAALPVVLAAGTAQAGDPFLRRTTTVEVVEQAGPAVVNITTEHLVRQGNPFRPLPATPSSTASSRTSSSRAASAPRRTWAPA